MRVFLLTLGLAAVGALVVGAPVGAGAQSRGNAAGFVEYQSILSYGCHDVEFFTIAGNAFLALTAFTDDVSYSLDSTIYRWNGYRFEPYQSIPTQGLVDWEFFTIDAVPFLALANHREGATYNVDSAIYRWDGARFVAFQSFPTHQSQDWEYFTIDDQNYLVINSNFSERLSTVYRWNGMRFEADFTLPIEGAVYDWEFFTIEGRHYLAAALGRFLVPVYELDSKVFRWEGGRFEDFQSIPTRGAHDWQYFTIAGEHYLAIANERGDTPGNVNSSIYRWDGGRFEAFQTIPTRGARGVRFFTLFDDDYYLVFANRFDHNLRSFTTDSTLYRWDGERFGEFQSFATQGAEDWTFFTISGDSFLAVANHQNSVTHKVGSKIYRWEGLPRFEIYLPSLAGGLPAPDFRHWRSRSRGAGL